LLPAGLAQAQVTVPNTFSAGTAASSAQVNQNFQALANAVNAASSTLSATAAGLAATNATVSALSAATSTLGASLSTTNATVATLPQGAAVTASYELLPSAIGALTSRNVVLIMDKGTGTSTDSTTQFDSYLLKVAYANTTGETITESGKTATPAYLYLTATITANTNYLQTSYSFAGWNVKLEKYGSANAAFLADGATYNLYTESGTVATTTTTYATNAGSVKDKLSFVFNDVCSTAVAYFNQVRTCYNLVTDTTPPGVTTTLLNLSTMVPIVCATCKHTSMTINSIVYTDLVARSRLIIPFIIEDGLAAPGLGFVTGFNMTNSLSGNGLPAVAYSRLNGATPVGSLTGTAFSAGNNTPTAPNGWLAGIWFQ
jgi:hypothetical protein